MARRRAPDRVVSIKHKPDSDRWQVRYVMRGKPGSRLFATEKAATRFAAVLQAKVVGGEKPPADPNADIDGDGTKAAHWIAILWRLAKGIMADPADETKQRALKAIASAASAAKQLVDIAEIEDEVLRQRDFMNSRLAERKFGFAESENDLSEIAQRSGSLDN